MYSFLKAMLKLLILWETDGNNFGTGSQGKGSNASFYSVHQNVHFRPKGLVNCGNLYTP